MVNHCIVISPQGEILAHDQSPVGEPRWLGSVHAAAAVLDIGAADQRIHALFAASDHGLSKIEQRGSKLVEVQLDSTKASLIPSGSVLLGDSKALYVVDAHRIDQVDPVVI